MADSRHTCCCMGHFWHFEFYAMKSCYLNLSTWYKSTLFFNDYRIPNTLNFPYTYGTGGGGSVVNCRVQKADATCDDTRKRDSFAAHENETQTDRGRGGQPFLPPFPPLRWSDDSADLQTSSIPHPSPLFYLFGGIFSQFCTGFIQTRSLADGVTRPWQLNWLAPPCS